jgi:hypothetical protein
MAEGWSEIQNHLKKSDFSVSRPVEDSLGRRALITEKGGSDLASLRAEKRAVARTLLQTDIARFYHTIYTHSIPWALAGKAEAKRNRIGGLGNELDRALRNGQDQQTLGIPVGPDTSLVIAEIIGASVDNKIEHIGPGFRFMDDFELCLPNTSAAESALVRIEEALGDFELAINPLKTSIKPLPQQLERDWIAEIREYRVDPHSEMDGKDLLRYFNLVFQLSNDHPGEPIIPYAVGRLRTTTVLQKDW